MTYTATHEDLVNIKIMELSNTFSNNIEEAIDDAVSVISSAHPEITLETIQTTVDIALNNPLVGIVVDVVQLLDPTSDEWFDSYNKYRNEGLNETEALYKSATRATIYGASELVTDFTGSLVIGKSVYKATIGKIGWAKAQLIDFAPSVAALIGTAKI